MITGFINNYNKYSANPAILINKESFSYGHLMAIVQQIKVKIDQANPGSTKAQLIGVYTDYCVETYASLLSVLLSGSGFVPLNKKFPEDKLASIIGSSGIRTILCKRASCEELEKILKAAGLNDAIGIVINDAEVDAPYTHPVSTPEFNPNEIAYLLFTSGSTGVPKGIGITHSNFSSFLAGMTRYGRYDFNSLDRFLQIFELSFDVSIACTFIPWEIGACLVPVSTEGIVFIEALETIRDHEVTVVSMAPSAIAYMKQLRLLDEFNFPSVRYSFLTGEALPDSLAEAWHATAPASKIENAYGPTEVTVWSFMYSWNATLSKKEVINGLVPIGTPLEEVEYSIVDQNLKPVADGTLGELLLYGNQVAPGYWKNEQKTSSTFVVNEHISKPGKWYRTGDVVVKNNLGQVVYINRMDNQVQINGFRVELGEIEFRIREHTKNDSAVVLAIQNENETIQLAAFVENLKVEVLALKEHLATVLPSYMVPRKIYSIPSMPLNNSGKIDRKKLLDLHK